MAVPFCRQGRKHITELQCSIYCYTRILQRRVVTYSGKNRYTMCKIVADNKQFSRVARQTMVWDNQSGLRQ